MRIILRVFAALDLLCIILGWESSVEKEYNQ